MSEPKSSPAADAPSSSSSSRFELYTKMYVQAYRLATSSTTASPQQADVSKNQQHILITIDTVAKLIFGLDVKEKTRVVLHGEGALELIMALVNQYHQSQSQQSQSNSIGSIGSRSSNTIEVEKIQTAALKAIKTCVLRNPAGRSRCRSAGILTFINSVLEHSMCIDSTSTSKEEGQGNTNANAILAEEAFTTLAAACLGDDLNALEASTNVKPFIQESTKIFPDANAKSMLQKTFYLETLFAAVEKEQEKLLKKIKTNSTGSNSNSNSNGNGNGTRAFFKDLVVCETNMKTAFNHLQDEKYAMSFKHYNHAMKLLLPFANDTALLNGMIMEIRIKRAQAALELNKIDECLEDTSVLLDSKDTAANEDLRSHLLKMHGKALILAGRVEEGKETLGKLMILSPVQNNGDDVELAKLLENLKADADE